MNKTIVLARIFFSAIFLFSGLSHFTTATQQYAMSQGIAPWLTMASGTLAFIGGLMIATGLRARIGGALVAAFLIPVTLSMHRFWAVADAAAAQEQMIHFMKNLSMLGGALAFMTFGSGPYSLDSLFHKRSMTPNEILFEAQRRHRPTTAGRG